MRIRAAGDQWHCEQQAALALADRIGLRVVNYLVHYVEAEAVVRLIGDRFEDYNDNHPHSGLN